jgi:acyl-coenzyme A synthetase/AMP-(fatty) acid ligase
MLLQRIGNRGIKLGTLFDRVAARHPANVVILDHDLGIAPELGRRMTVAELADLVDDLASRFWSAGVRPADRVVIYQSNSFDITLLACVLNRIGAVPVLLSPKLDGATVDALVRRIDRPYLLTDQAKLTDELPPAIVDHARQVFLAAGEHPGTTSMRSLAGAPRVPVVTMPADRPALITHTSGTTGLPKLAVHTGWTLQARYRPQALAAGLVRKRLPVAVHVSFVHSRLFTAMAIALLRGLPLIMLVDDAPEHVAEVFARLRPGVVEAHPNSFMAWEQLADDPRRPLAGVKYFSSTFDAIHPRTVHRMLRASRHRFPVFAQLYGQSEVGPVVGRVFTRLRHESTDGRCVGFPFFGMTGVRVVSRDGRPVTESSPGFIEVRTNGRVLTYLGEPKRYAEQERDGWWRMGDVGYRTRWGCLHLLDREVDVIPGFGSSLAAEDALFSRLEDLVEVVIVASPDGRPIPVVCTRDDRPLDMAAWARATASLPLMAPPVQRSLKELPKTATTKIKRLELARLLGDASRVG